MAHDHWRDNERTYTLRASRAGALIATYPDQTRDEVAESIRDSLNALEKGSCTFYVQAD